MGETLREWYWIIEGFLPKPKFVDPEKVIIRFDSIYESSLTAKVSQKKSA